MARNYFVRCARILMSPRYRQRALPLLIPINLAVQSFALQHMDEFSRLQRFQAHSYPVMDQMIDAVGLRYNERGSQLERVFEERNRKIFMSAALLRIHCLPSQNEGWRFALLPHGLSP